MTLWTCLICNQNTQKSKQTNKQKQKPFEKLFHETNIPLSYDVLEQNNQCKVVKYIWTLTHSSINSSKLCKCRFLGVFFYFFAQQYFQNSNDWLYANWNKLKVMHPDLLDIVGIPPSMESNIHYQNYQSNTSEMWL